MAGTEMNQMTKDGGAAVLADEDESQCVVFRLFEEEFGININNVKEIVRLPDITPIPRSPDYVSGICNLRGNVLPIIDTRVRFGLDAQKATDQTRLLVVESAGAQISLVVDNVREVMRMKNALMEPPPAVCRGVDRQFLDAVVKVDEGRRLILMLNLDEVVAVDQNIRQTAAAGTARNQTVSENKNAVSEEEQLVSFRVGDDEYAFDIARVSEILKVMDITAVPNVPGHVLGLFTIRNHLLPILDMRGILGLPALVTERLALFDRGFREDQSWVEMLRNALDAGIRFTGVQTARETSFGQWLENYNTASVEVETLVKRLKRLRTDMYSTGKQILDLGAKDKSGALAMVGQNIDPVLKVVTDIYTELKSAISGHIREDQRAMVVECGMMTVGFLVDWVDEVLRIPKSVIDPTPAMASSGRGELKSVAKLNDGDRLIMIMDESALVSRDDTDALSRIQEDAQKASKSAEGERQDKSSKTLDEEQLVTFSIGKEEYGLRIMQVQEINRLTDITGVPRAPYYIDGMTNLRGNVIPVINIRRLFGLEDRDADDRTRVIIVDIAGQKTGLRVDQVNEVLRLAKADIDPTPGIVTDEGGQKLIQGVCKFDDGKRMVVLLDVAQMLDSRELQTMKRLSGSLDEDALSEETPAGRRRGEGKKSGSRTPVRLKISE